MKILLSAIAVSAAATWPALADAPDFGPGGKTVLLPYVDPVQNGGGIDRPPGLHLSFGGRTVRAVMDTGSTGIVVSQDVIPDLQNLTSRGPARLTYTSSGRVMVGSWIVTPVTITGADGTSVSVAPLPVLAVSSIECLREARDCVPEDDPRRVAMMGVGFGRESDRQGQGTPDKNPFLHVADMEGGSMRRGYVVTGRGVQLGLSEETARGFHYVKLARNQETGDWAGVPSCIALAGGQASCGTALVDTGVTAMFLSLPPQAETGLVEDDGGGRTLASGTEVEVNFGDASGPGYTFKAGDLASAAAPERIVLVGDGSRPTFVNTSVHALNAFDLLFDDEGGYLGIRLLAK